MIEIKNRWTGAVIYRSETATTVRDAVIELATKARSEGKCPDLRGSNLRGSDLSGSNLSGSNLSGSNLRGSNLSGSNLRDSNLRGSNLRDSDLRDSDLSGSNLRDSNLRDSNLSEIRDDVWRVLDAAPTEALELLYAVREGRINGSAYTGECACLVGTVANLRSCSVYELPMEIRPDSSREAERWFLGMRPGDTPEHHPVSRITAEWIEEWMRAHDMPVPRAVSHEQAHAFVRANMANFEAFVAHEKKPKASEL